LKELGSIPYKHLSLAREAFYDPAYTRILGMTFAESSA